MSFNLSLAAQESAILRGLRGIVSDARAEWIGVQTTMDAHQAELVFRNPTTARKMIIRFNPIAFNGSELFEKIQKMIEADTGTSAEQKVSVAILKLKHIADTLLSISKELDALCARRKD